MNCPSCDQEMLIVGNHDFNDMMMEELGEGIVYDINCENKECNIIGLLLYEKIKDAEMPKLSKEV